MRTVLFLVMALAFLRGPASGQPGGGTDLFRINREVEEMTRDGRWQQLLDRAQAGPQATGGLRPTQDPTRRIR